MARRRRRVARSAAKRGMAPGSLVFTGERRLDRTQLAVFAYDAETLEEVRSESLGACVARRDRPVNTWINVDGLHDVEAVESLGRAFGIHPLVLEDILATGQRAKVEDYDSTLFVVAQMLTWDATHERIEAEQVSFVLGDRFLLTFQEQGGDVFEPVRERLRTNRGRMRKAGPDYLLYALLDAIVDNYYGLFEKFDDRIEALDDDLAREAPDNATPRTIHALKRELIFLRRAVWPLREAVSALARQESPLVQDETRIFLRDVQDHAVQALETVETFREVLTGLLDIYMSTLNNRLNSVIKVLTIFATIFAPLTFIVGVYGMNFDHMPELRWRWGYPVVWLLMLVVALGMLREFKRRHWF